LRAANVATSVEMGTVGLQTDCFGQTPSWLNQREGCRRRRNRETGFGVGAAKEADIFDGNVEGGPVAAVA
jgi:hypothetical protein